MDCNRPRLNTQAYGLIELLLVTAAASLLFILLIQLFVQLSQTTFRLEQQAVHNEVVYFGLTEMKRDIRMARYLPCGQTATPREMGAALLHYSLDSKNRKSPESKW